MVVATIPAFILVPAFLHRDAIDPHERPYLVRNIMQNTRCCQIVFWIFIFS